MKTKGEKDGKSVIYSWGTKSSAAYFIYIKLNKCIYRKRKQIYVKSIEHRLRNTHTPYMWLYQVLESYNIKLPAHESISEFYTQSMSGYYTVVP